MQSIECYIMNIYGNKLFYVLLKMISYYSLPAIDERDTWRKMALEGHRSSDYFWPCVGAIDGTHVPLKKPPQSMDQYICRKQFASLNFQCVVDNLGNFIDVICSLINVS